MPDDLIRVETELLRVVSATDDFLTDVASHLINAGGKRVRPGFCIAAAAVHDANGRAASIDVIRGGCAVELVHIGSLYHDDVMDGATTRRGVKSINAQWGNLRAILAGDYLLGRASELAAGLGTEVALLLATTITELCSGQILELESAYCADRTFEQYQRSISGKTASLLATACRIGGIVADVDRPTIDALSEFGRAYGMAFQIVDDIFDLVGTAEQLGKPAGNDLLEGIYTLPVIFSLGEVEVADELRSLLARNISIAKRDRICELVRKGGGVELAAATAETWASKAAASLSGFPDTPGTAALLAAVHYLMERLNTVR